MASELGTPPNFDLENYYFQVIKKMSVCFTLTVDDDVAFLLDL